MGPNGTTPKAAEQSTKPLEPVSEPATTEDNGKENQEPTTSESVETDENRSPSKKGKGKKKNFKQLMPSFSFNKQKKEAKKEAKKTEEPTAQKDTEAKPEKENEEAEKTEKPAEEKPTGVEGEAKEATPEAEAEAEAKEETTAVEAVEGTPEAATEESADKTDDKPSEEASDEPATDEKTEKKKDAAKRSTWFENIKGYFVSPEKDPANTKKDKKKAASEDGNKSDADAKADVED